MFGGSGPVVLSSLGIDGVYGTLIPSSATSDFEISLVSDGMALSATALSLANGEALYVVPEPATWVLAGMATLVLLAVAHRRTPMLRPALAGAAFVCLVQLASTCEGSYIFTVNQVDLGDGYLLSGGFIETDIDSGNLTPADILDYQIVVTGPVPFTFSPTNPDPAIYVDETVSVTPEEIVVPINSQTLGVHGNLLSFAATVDGFDRGIDFYNTNVAKLGPRTTIEYYNDSPPDYVDAVAGFDPPIPIQIAAAVPEPSTVLLLLAGAPSLLHRMQRHRPKRRGREARALDSSTTSLASSSLRHAATSLDN